MPYRSISISKTFFTTEINVPRAAYLRNKDLAPRTSVLKYWKNYLKNNFELERKRDEADHIKNLAQKPRIYFFHR